jgi:SnoaL-like polyketide cyclase
MLTVFIGILFGSIIRRTSECLQDALRLFFALIPTVSAMILRRAKNNSLGLLDLFPQTENVLREMRFVIFPVTEHKLVIAQVDELGFALANTATSLRQGFPDIRFTIEDLIAEGDRVTVRSTAAFMFHFPVGKIQLRDPTKIVTKAMISALPRALLNVSAITRKKQFLAN